MGGVIEKFAFQPPPREDTVNFLKRKKVLYTGHANAKEPSRQVSMLYFQASPTVKRTTLLYSHGNAEDLAHGYHMLEQWHRDLDVDILAYDYTGYGASGGEKPSESMAYKDVKAALTYATIDLGIDRSKIILVGRSLGSGPTTDIASKERGLGGMALIAPLSSCASVGAGNAGYYGAYAFDVFPNIRKIGKVYDYPVHIFHGEKDEVVPFQHGQDLLKEVTKSNYAATHTWLPDTGHNNIEQRQGDLFFRDFRGFIQVCQNFKYDIERDPKGAKRLAKQANSSSGFSSSLSSCSGAGADNSPGVAERKSDSTF